MKLSIVSTLYLSAPYLREFYDRTVAAATKHTPDFEIVLVNDGSPDQSLELALELHRQDPRVRVIDLSRNFGHQKAMMTGLAHARGDDVFLIDCDLEEAPELLAELHAERERTHSDVVYGVQKSRKGGVFEKISGSLFYWFLNAISTTPIPKNALTARLMSSSYVRSLVAHEDRELFLLGVLAITGFKQAALTVEKKDKGSSTYSLARKISVMVNSFTSFSNAPLYFVFWLGLLISGTAGAASLYLIIHTLFFGGYLTGWPSLITSIWLIGGLIIFCLGVIGIYVAKVFSETKRRPYTVIRQIHERQP